MGILEGVRRQKIHYVRYRYSRLFAA